MATIISINPFTEGVNGQFEVLSREQLDQKISKAHEAYLAWKTTPNSEKKRLFLSLADVIDGSQAELAELEMKEMGMLYSASFTGISKTANLVRWFANNFEKILADEFYESE